MATYNLEEQEQLAALKAWWQENGTSIIVGVCVVLIALAGWRGWNYYERNQAVQASGLYAVVQRAAAAGDLSKVREAAGAVIEHYPRTTYAAMAALVSAKANFEGGDLKTAHAQLAWVANNAEDANLRDIARLRLVSVMLDQKAYADALNVLDAKHGAAFDALFLAARGDVLVAQGKKDAARSAYKGALDKAAPDDAGLRGSIQLRLDALGTAK
jgi:predicted negative regulator of RcsB-dependent stress response